MSITIYLLGDIHRIMYGTLTINDGIVTINGVSHHKRVVGMDSSSSRTGNTSGDGGIKAFATREGKDGYNHTQCQE